MRTSLQQSVVMKQELRMNPRLYQAMDLLYMPLLELQQQLKVLEKLLATQFHVKQSLMKSLKVLVLLVLQQHQTQLSDSMKHSVHMHMT